MTDAILLAAVLAACAALIWVIWKQQENQNSLPPEAEDARIPPLLRGINYLLSDEPDRALKELVHVAKLQTETAEVYLALGDMFRNKGEFGRAVRIHQNLLARPDLPDHLHMQAQLALAIDFQVGGLLGRALQQYQRVLDVQPGHIQALQGSLRIREQGREWEIAEEFLQRLDRVRGVTSSLHHAYLLTEMGRQELARHDEKQALELVEQAIGRDPACAAAHMLLAEIDLRRGEIEAAIESMRQLYTAAPYYLPLMIPMLLANHDAYDQHGRDFLMHCWQQSHDELLALGWLKAMHGEHGVEAARNLIREMHFEPQTLPACLHIKALVGDDDPLSRASREWQRAQKNVACVECGVEFIDMRWQCPQCHEWGSMRPIREKKKP
ncbi:MAG: tetratricopeptide repeat protein [Mariprofundaceae bacterium]